jgi:hypothetical protein
MTVRHFLRRGWLVLPVVILFAFAAASSSAKPTPPPKPTQVPCSTTALVAAINAANSAGGGSLDLAGHCTYQLTVANNVLPMVGGNGLPVITAGISIDGHGSTIAGNNTSFRIFMVSGPNGSLSLRNLTLTGGHATFVGGAIFNSEGTLDLDHVVVTGNFAQAGGGIATGTGGTGPVGTATIRHSRIVDNTATGDENAHPNGGGGIVSRGGTLTLDHSVVSGNSAFGGGGIATGPGNPVNGGSSTTITHSSIDHNTATGGQEGGGGGIANGGTLMVDHSRITDNSAPAGFGAGLLNHGAQATVSHSHVSGNMAANADGVDGMGGGIANANFGLPVTPTVTLTLDHTNVDHNFASGGGGGIFNAEFGGPATVVLDHSNVHGNQIDNCESTGTPIAGCTG